MTEILLESVCKKFGSTEAVRDLNLNIKDGEFMVLLGPSGCGKTTTLRMIAGLEKPTGGSIYFDGKKVNDLEPKERNIAMVFQEYALYPHMTVFDNIALNLKVSKVPKDEIQRRVMETAKLLKIEELLQRKPGELSGGQQQRVALGRAIVRNPSVYLMDEPLSNLDAILRVKMRAELKKLHERLGTTTVYVTHDQVEAMTLADRVAIMDKGILLQVGDPQQVYMRPATKFVGEFVGSPPMNFMESSLIEKNGKFFLCVDHILLEIERDLAKFVREKASGPDIVIGIRPENVKVYTRPMKNLIKTKIYLVQRLGNDTYVSLEVGKNLIIARTSPAFKNKEGDEAYIKFDKKHMHIIDKKSEKVIV
ncbi:MAG: glycerol-3-phosphate ABC transporter ATP-binding protein [Hadesarchaea archaeon YNP_N21]|jgi:multiple sugar transport system ATP-binding protein|nr:MAG: glycerol-3-phosphate ABC transporter ATP-binding protein [Hadesarchaea archaeon YNP_N21]